MSSEYGDQGNLSPQEVGRILSCEIADELNARFAGPEHLVGDELATYSERIMALYDRSVALLMENGHEQLLSQMFSDNMNYFNNLLTYSVSERFLGILPAEPQDPILKKSFEQVAASAHSKPLTPPSFDDYAGRLPAGFEDLFAAVFAVDHILNRNRYTELKSMTDNLLHFGRNSQKS